MVSLRKVYYYNKYGDKNISGYNICISKNNVKIAGFDDAARVKVTAEKGKIIIEQEGKKDD